MCTCTSTHKYICWIFINMTKRRACAVQKANSIRCAFGCRRSVQNTANHNHRPCRWYAQAPLGPFTSRAYRLIELSFACVSCPATADAVICTPLLAPSDEGAGFCGAKDWGREYSSSCFSPSVFAYGESTSLIRGRQAAAAELGIAKAFWNHQHTAGGIR